MRRYKIGRSDTNEIVIADASVSRQHAELAELGGGRFTLTDLGSTYGTQVWQGQTWAPAAETEIRQDTVIRFGEFQTTLMDVLSEAQRAALGLKPAAPAAPVAPSPPSPAAPVSAPAVEPAPPPDPPKPAAPIAVSAPAPKPPEPAPAPEPSPPAVSQAPRAAPAAPSPPAPATPSPPEPAAAPSQPTPAAPPAEPRPRPARTESAPPRLAPRLRPGRSAVRRKSLMIGLLGLAIFAGIAAIAIAGILLLGDANPPARSDPPPRAGNAEAQSRMLEACTKEWEVPERRCRCFLSAAGPHLLAEDYDDFAEMMGAYVSGDTDRQESALQRAGEKRGAPASSRLTAAFKGAVRDCQQ